MTAEARKAERVQAVTDTGLFGEKYIAENAERWAAMADEAWTTQLAEYTALKDTRGPAAPTPPVPSGAAAGAPALTDSLATGDEGKPSAVRQLLDQRKAGVDITKITI